MNPFLTCSSLPHPLHRSAIRSPHRQPHRRWIWAIYAALKPSGLDLVQIPFPVADDAGSLTVAFRPEPLGDLPAFANHAIVDLRPHALVIVDSLEANVHELDAEHLNFLRRRGEELFLDLLAPFLD